MNSPQITRAQRKAAAALDLPFVLSDADIARQFDADGNARPASTRNPMARAKSLATAAMNDAAAIAKAA